MKEIRAWQILKLPMSLILKKQIAIQPALVTFNYWRGYIGLSETTAQTKSLSEIPIATLFTFKVWTPLDILRPASERKLTQMELETENAYWLIQLEVDPGCYLNLLL